jgi:hypothetical protein
MVTDVDVTRYRAAEISTALWLSAAVHNPLRKTLSLPDDVDVPIHDSLVVEF